MNKVAVVFWSGSGNTEAMANAIKRGVEKANAVCDLFFVSDFDKFCRNIRWNNTRLSCYGQ